MHHISRKILSKEFREKEEHFQRPKMDSEWFKDALKLLKEARAK